MVAAATATVGWAVAGAVPGWVAAGRAEKAARGMAAAVARAAEGEVMAAWGVGVEAAAREATVGGWATAAWGVEGAAGAVVATAARGCRRAR